MYQAYEKANRINLILFLFFNNMKTIFTEFS